ncbi:SDR family NAD(P)-dependent oxidoreductase [Reichenbachiella sp. MSK19-1]|uniref:SDR family NAD(P)-dependent oxidoreductase n=1 Tax=Reichenbachiella sp. MSK19-1 TaxID=1897631 RepID=UPI0021010391|nr:SDR family NAD(P)-dependent oxidoreductase [Reichenbachiella sp. MSK19-1]
MTKALITGANKSIGFETAGQQLQQGYYVYIGSRSIERGNLAIEKRKNEGVTNAESIHLDVNDTASVD